ncbi:hypothetical protein HG530_010361 [Fusarium avenaceum]|nr:hypothetical protein HG530_010361 [Fusarium avenaceum]
MPNNNPTGNFTARALVLAAGALTTLYTVGSTFILVVLVPVGQHGTNLGRVGQLVHIFKVLLGQREGLGRHVGNVLSDQLGGIDRCLVDLLEQERSERLDTRSEEGRVERHIDTAERDGSKATLKLKRSGLGQRLLGTAANDLAEVALDLLNVVLDLFDINLLDLDEVGHTSKSVERTEVTSTHVLHVGNVVVDNLKEPTSLLSNVVDNELESSLVEGLADAAGVDSAHGVVGSASGITLDGNLHGKTSVEHDRHQTLNGHDLCKGSQGRVFTERVTGEGAVVGHKSLGLHVLEAGLLHQGKGGLRELSGREKTSRGAVGVRGSSLINALEDLLRLDATIGGNSLEGHRDVVLADGLTTRSTEVDGELLGVVLHNVGDGETVGVQEVLVSTVPNLLGNGAAGVQLHTHTLLLRALASENIRCGRLLNLGLTLENLVLSLLVADLNLDDLATRDHARVLELDLELIVGQNHADERGVEASDTANVVLGGPGLDETSHGCTRVHAVGDGAGKVGIAGEDTRDVDGVVVTRDTSVVLVGSRGSECQRRLAAERDRVLEVDRLVNRLAISLKVINDGVTVGLSGLVIHAADLDDLLSGELKQDLAPGLNAAEDGLVLVAHQALESEGQSLAEQLNVLRKLVDREPLLGAKDGDVPSGGKVHLDGSLNLALEGVLVVGVGTTVEELRGDLHNRLSITGECTADLNHLASLLVDDSVDLSSGGDLITLLERLSARDHAELVRQVNKLQQVTIDGAREDRLGDSLPANDDGKVHRSIDGLARSVNESLAGVANGMDEVVNGLASNSSLATIELGSDIGIQSKSLVTEPSLPVELLNAVVTSLHDLTDRRVTSLRVVSELQGQSDSLAKSSSILDHVDLDLVLANKLDLNDVDVLVGARLLADHNSHGQAFDIKGHVEVHQLTTEVLGVRNGGLIVLVHIPSEVLNMSLVNAIEDSLNRLIKLGGELNSGRALKNAGSANILVNDSVQVLGLPQRVLLEVELEVVIKDRNESDRLLGGSHAHEEEVLNILSVDDLSLSIRVSSDDTVNQLERLVELRVALEQGCLARSGGQTLLKTVDVVTDEEGVGAVDPAGLMLDVEKLDETSQNLGVGHVVEVNSLSLLVATEPDLLAIVVELLDNIVLVLLEFSDSLLLGEVEDLLVHLGPEANSSSCELVDRLTHLGSDGENTTSRSLVGLLPLTVIKTRSGNDGLLGSLAGMSLLGDHHTATEQATIEGHGRVAVLLGPVTSDVGVCVISTTEATTSNKNNVLLSSDTAVHRKNGVVEILERVVTTATTTSPLEHNREVGVCLGNVNNSLDSIKRTGLEADVLKSKCLDVLVGNLDRRNTSTNGETLNGNALRSELADQGDLPSHGTGVDVDQVDRDTTTSGDSFLDLGDSIGHHGTNKVATASKLDVVSSVHSGGNEVPRNGTRSHTSDQDGRKTKQTTHLGVEVCSSTLVCHKLGAELLNPIVGILDSVLLISVEDLSLVAEVVHATIDSTSQDDTDTSALLVSAGQNTKTGDTTWAEVQNVGGIREDGSLLPVDGVASDQANQSRNNVALDLLSEILASVGVEHSNTEITGID